MTSSVVRVDVECPAPGTLDVTWEIDGPPAPVDLSVGPTPERIDHVHSVTVEAGRTSTRLVDLGPGRHFVSASIHGSGSALVAADRRVLFEGLQNFRDLGGYPTTDGRTTRWGTIFRADSLHKLTAGDLVEFERLGMRSVFDLRGDEERARHPNPVVSVQLAIVGRPEPADDPANEIVSMGSDGERILRDLYIGMLEHSGALFGRMLTALTERNSLPAVFHCHAGKDRTGIAAALLLLALGVDRSVVLDDYELTRRYRRFEHQQDSYERLLGLGLVPEAAAGVLSAPRWAMDEAVQALDETYGGADRYLVERAGMPPSQLDQLRARLTE